MINSVYEVLNTVLNKENRGYVSPTEFNLLAKQVQDKIFKSYFEDLNRDKNKENRGLTNPGNSNLVFQQNQKLKPFRKKGSITETTGSYALPSDLYYIEDEGISLSSNGRIVEHMEISGSGYAKLSIAAPSEVYPIYDFIEDAIEVSPSTVTEDLDIRYLRQPKSPKWTYTEVLQKELFNPSSTSFQDFELHVSEFSNIVIEMLTYFGINLREEQVVQIAEQLKQTSFNKENA